MKTAIMPGALMGLLALSTVATLHAQSLQSGIWVGRVIHPTLNYMDVKYDVERQGDTFAITMNVMDYMDFPLDDLQYATDSLSFTWQASVPMRCTLRLLDDGIYQGACIDPWENFGAIIMAPPGSNVEAIEIDRETVADVAGWSPEDAAPRTLGENYPLGRLVDVGGYALNLFEAGAGDVTVVLEAGLGDNLRIWEPVQLGVSAFARVVAYDRAGLGASEPSPSARTPEQIATELHKLLRLAGITPPYVLVGQEAGGLYIRRFASLYPDKVAGMVLVDASHEAQGQRWQALDAQSWADYLAGKQAFYALTSAPMKAEFDAYAEVLRKAAVPGLGPLPNVPLAVLTGMRAPEKPRWIGETEKGLKVRHALQQEWVDQVEGSTFEVIKTSGPNIHQEAPEKVVEAIRQVVEATRKRR